MAIEDVSIHDTIGKYISLSRFAKCVGVSRPTLYKYMEAYDSGRIELIPDNVLTVFDRASMEKDTKTLHSFFNDLYINFVRTEERRQFEHPVPPDIAEIVDSENLNVKDIDRMMDRAQKHLDILLKKESVNEDEVENVRKDIRDLQYTREMVERRQAENRFILIYSDYWTSCTGPEESDTIDCDEQTESDIPGIDSNFRFYLTRAKLGYTLFFYNDVEGDNIEVQLLTGTYDDKTKDVMGIFHPDPGMKFVRIPDLFDEDFEELFRYRIIRSRDGRVLNKAIGKFTV